MNKRIKKKIYRRAGYKNYKNYYLFINNKLIPEIYESLNKQMEEILFKYFCAAPDWEEF